MMTWLEPHATCCWGPSSSSRLDNLQAAAFLRHSSCQSSFGGVQAKDHCSRQVSGDNLLDKLLLIHWGHETLWICDWCNKTAGIQIWVYQQQVSFCLRNLLPALNLLLWAFLVSLDSTVCIHTCVVELPRKTQVESEVGDLWTQLLLRLEQSL